MAMRHDGQKGDDADRGGRNSPTDRTGLGHAGDDSVPLVLQAQYLYAIVPADLMLAEDLCGIDDQPVVLITHQALAVAASPTSRTQIRPERAQLAAHHAVLKALMAEATVLPMAFGTIAQSMDDIRQFIGEEAESLIRQLARVQGTYEIGLRARLVVPDVMTYLVAAVPALRASRDAAFGGGRSPTHHERIALGTQVDRELERLRERHVAQLLPALMPMCVDICRNPPRDIAELLNLACLVRRQDQQAFERALEDCAEAFDDCITFELSGPWAPHHFCHVEFTTGDGHASP